MSNTRNFTHNSNFTFNTNLFGETTTYAIQGVNLPGISFNHIGSGKSSENLYLQGDTLTFGVLNITLIIDENLVIWKDLINKIFTMREHGIGDELEEMSWLEVQDDNSNKILKVMFYDCKIESVSDLSFTSSNEDEVITLDVSLVYDYYEIS